MHHLTIVVSSAASCRPGYARPSRSSTGQPVLSRAG